MVALLNALCNNLTLTLFNYFWHKVFKSSWFKLRESEINVLIYFHILTKKQKKNQKKKTKKKEKNEKNNT